MKMQTLIIYGELAEMHYYPGTKDKRDTGNLGTYIKLYSDIHKWRMESYGIWWSGINERTECCITINRIWSMALLDTESEE